MIAESETYEMTRFLNVNDKGVNILTKDEGREFIARLIIDDELFTECGNQMEVTQLYFSKLDYIHNIDFSNSKSGKVDDK